MSARDPRPAQSPVQSIDARRASASPAVLGSYDATGRFRFHSERDRINWLRKGYRQGTDPDAFARGTPLPPAEAALYASGAVEPPAHVFQGPDGTFRGKNAATREKPEVHAARMQAWEGVRFKDVDPEDETHPGEDAAVDLMLKGGAAPSAEPTEGGMPAGPVAGKTAATFGRHVSARSMGHRPEPAADHDQLYFKSAPADRPTPRTVPSLEELGLGGWVTPARPPRDENLGQSKPGATDVEAPASASPAVQGPEIVIPMGPKSGPQGSGAAADVTTLIMPLPKRHVNPGYPTPYSFTWRQLEDPDIQAAIADRKKTWDEEEQQHPEAVARDKEDFSATIAKQASNDFFAYHHKVPNVTELSIINDAAREIAGISPAETARIQDGPADLQTFFDALTLGDTLEMSVDGETVLETPVETPQRHPGSWGNKFTQLFNAVARDATQKHLEECREFERVEHVGGVTKENPATGERRKREITLQDPARPGTKGSRRMDISFLVEYRGQKCLFHINTADYDAKERQFLIRELIAMQEAINNAKGISANQEVAKTRWANRFRNNKLATQNAFAIMPKPISGDEAAFKSLVKDALKHLRCAEISAKCVEVGLVGGLPNGWSELK